MPFYELTELQELVSDGAWEFGTENCKLKVRAYGLTDEDVEALVLSLKGGNFRKEFGPAKTEFGILDADDYLVWYDEIGHKPCAKNQGMLFYVKLAVYSDKNGVPLCVIVRLHPSS